jgi:hypothetical protein
MEELLHFDLKKGGIDRKSKNRVGIAALASLTVGKRVLTDDDGRDLPQSLAFPDDGKKLFRPDAGHVELGDDKIGIFLPVGPQHLIVRGNGE